MLRASRSLLVRSRETVAKFYKIKPRVVTVVQETPCAVSVCCYSQQLGDVTATAGSGEITAGTGIGQRYLALEELTSLQKGILVSTNVYPDVESIPNKIPISKMRLAYDKFRVKVAVMMTVAAFTACGVIMADGHYKRKHGTATTWKQHIKSQMDI